MSLTSLNMASLGELDRGGLATLNAASLGLLRIGEVDGKEINPTYDRAWHRPDPIKERRLREDDEILAVIVAYMSTR